MKLNLSGIKHRLRSFLQVPFLNLLANLADRAGYVPIRLGGNTQEDALLVDSLPNGRFIAKLGTHDVPVRHLNR